MLRLAKFPLIAVALATLVACSSLFVIDYTPVDRATSSGWSVTDVVVRVPDSLTVSEAKTLIPNADIVWREDPAGDRKAQIAAIVREAARRGAGPLNGPRPVRLVIDIKRFHALTYEAEALSGNTGVHNINFFASIVDARSGAVLRGPDFIESATPAFSGAEAKKRRARGETQRSVIQAHIAATIAGWLSVGPDNRGSFNRTGA